MDQKAKQRAEVILKVQLKEMTATEGAEALGVSRKTFYEWQERGLAALRAALRDRPGGRPPLPVDPEKEQLQATVANLEHERHILEGRLRIQEVIRDVLAETPAPKKKRAV